MLFGSAAAAVVLPGLLAAGVDGDLDRCGANALTSCLRFVGIDAKIGQVDGLAGERGDQTSLLDLQRAAGQLSAKTVSLRWSRAIPGNALSRAPAVVPIRFSTSLRHFVAIVDCQSGRYLTADFPHGWQWMPDEELRTKFGWDGTALHVARHPADIAALQSVGRGRTWWLLVALMALASGCVLLVSPRFLRRGANSAVQLPARSTAGFTLIELLVALAVIGILVSLLAPAVHRVRESARAVDCRQRLHQIGIATENFFATRNQHVPSPIPALDGQGRRVSSQNQSPQLILLPHLDQAPIGNQFDQREDGHGLNYDPPTTTYNPDLLELHVPVWECPSDPSGRVRANYRICNGTSPLYHETTAELGEPRALIGFRSLLGLPDARFVDGKSNTVTFAEKLAGDFDADHFSAYRDSLNVSPLPWTFTTPTDVIRGCQSPVALPAKHFSFGGHAWFLSGNASTWYNHILPPNSRTPDCVDGGNPNGMGAFTARSLHPGGVHALFGDGSARFVAESIDAATWAALGTIAGNETVEADLP